MGDHVGHPQGVQEKAPKSGFHIRLPSEPGRHGGLRPVSAVRPGLVADLSSRCYPGTAPRPPTSLTLHRCSSPTRLEGSWGQVCPGRGRQLAKTRIYKLVSSSECHSGFVLAHPRPQPPVSLPPFRAAFDVFQAPLADDGRSAIRSAVRMVKWPRFKVQDRLTSSAINKHPLRP